MKKIKETKETIAVICVFLLMGVAVFVAIFNIIQQREEGVIVEREQYRGIMLQVCTDTPRGIINVGFLESQGISQADATRLLAQLTDCPERARVQALILPSNDKLLSYLGSLGNAFDCLRESGVIDVPELNGSYNTIFHQSLEILQQVIAHEAELRGAR